MRILSVHFGAFDRASVLIVSEAVSGTLTLFVVQARRLNRRQPRLGVKGFSVAPLQGPTRSLEMTSLVIGLFAPPKANGPVRYLLLSIRGRRRLGSQKINPDKSLKAYLAIATSPLAP